MPNLSKRQLIAGGIVVGYIFLFALYFAPVEIAYKGAIPLSFLTVCSLFCSPWTMTSAMLFSAVGDLMGICHNFPAQMGAFAVAHVAFVWFFVQNLRRTGWHFQFSRQWKGVALVLLVWAVVCSLFAPHVQPVVLRVGVMVYAFLILAMLWSACQQSDRWYVVGAVLFVFSDFILAWNKFLSPIEGSRYWIMVPYLLGQLTLFIRSVVRR